MFSSGRALTAEDVVYTFNRILDPETGSGVSWKLGGVSDISASDERTVVFTLENPNPGLLTKLAVDKTMGIIARENVEDGSISTQPIGSGPFMISDFQPGVQVLLERNPNYWQAGLPYPDAKYRHHQ